VPQVSYRPLGQGLYWIDAFLADEPHRLACYLFDTPQRVLVDCGPSHSIEHLFAALEPLGIADVATLALTHIHLDHAGGAGHFAAHFPKAQIAVHHLGATHLFDPTRLVASTIRALGVHTMEAVFGPVAPVAAERLVVLDE
jgi:glyoxylase-like metal-dependent hydrolase (beta-lactamase superfamily II)